MSPKISDIESLNFKPEKEIGNRGFSQAKKSTKELRESKGEEKKSIRQWNHPM